MKIQEAKCPKCGADFSHLHAIIPTLYPITCIQGKWLGYDEKKGELSRYYFDEETEVQCTECGCEAKWKVFLKEKSIK